LILIYKVPGGNINYNYDKCALVAVFYRPPAAKFLF